MRKLADIETAAKIKLALVRNGDISGFDIGVEVVNGIVFLTGAVQAISQKEMAEQIAHEHGGIDIKNDIQVLSEQTVSDEEMPSEFLTGDAVPMENAVLRDRVISALEMDHRVNSYSINVDAVGRVVRLSGFQEDEAAARRAEEIARHVDGVLNVINDIEIRAAA